MTSHPIDDAKALTPSWRQDIHSFDALEIHPVREYRENGQSWHEQCSSDEAHYWCVFGHLKTGGVDGIQDFDTEAEALAFAERLLEAYPHLRPLTELIQPKKEGA